MAIAASNVFSPGEDKFAASLRSDDPSLSDIFASSEAKLVDPGPTFVDEVTVFAEGAPCLQTARSM